MKNRFIFSLIIFSMLFIIPMVALYYLEQKIGTTYETNEVIVIDFEEYLRGVVASEMPAEFSIEALKAQAVTARTYLLYKLKKFPNGQPEHLDASVCTGTHCQVWNSKDDLIAMHEEGWYDKYWLEQDRR